MGPTANKVQYYEYINTAKWRLLILEDLLARMWFLEMYQTRGWWIVWTLDPAAVSGPCMCRERWRPFPGAHTSWFPLQWQGFREHGDNPYGCSGQERIPACRCHILPTKSSTMLKWVWGRCLGQGWEPKGLVGEGQGFTRMGLVWREVRILPQRAAIPRAFYFYFYHNTCAKSSLYIL